MGAVKVDLEHSCWTAEYLLDHCERYRIESSGRALGIVEEVVRSPDGDEPVALLVRTNRGDRPLVTLTIDDVLELHPDGERIVVRASVGD
jgi:hypothetical protein